MRLRASEVMKRLGIAALSVLTLAISSPADAGPASFYTKVSVDQHTPSESPLEAEAAQALKDAINRRLRNALPCAKVSDEQDVRDKLSDAKRAQVAAQSDPRFEQQGAAALEAAREMSNAEYLITVRAASIGRTITLTPVAMKPSAGKVIVAESYHADPRDPKQLVAAIEEVARKFTDSVKSELKVKCPARYYIRGNDKAGRFDIVVEGFSRDGLFGAWDVYWTATAETDGVTSKMFVKEDVLTSNEPDNLGDISGTGWVYQHIQMGDLEMESSGTITVGGTATIGGGTDDPTITLTMAKFAINTSGAGSAGNETFAQKATMSGSKGDAQRAKHSLLRPLARVFP
jgi:hypothetical protein